MHYDSGEVLSGLHENWTFLGANAMEWCAGLVVFLMISIFATSPAKAMPMMLAGWILTTYQLALLRKMFPDEERGVRNAVMTACGFPPPDIPAPASLQPIWSGAPVDMPPANSQFMKLGLDELFPTGQRELIEEEA